MNLPIKKIVSASAGTGKTYRLALEFVALILKYWQVPGFQPGQILVITFTRKATAEIRDRIFQQLEILGAQKDGWKELAVNLKLLANRGDDLDRNNPLLDREILLINDAYRHLCTHKDELRVMTIDSYIHNIFRNLVRPVKGIDRFELDLNSVDKRILFLFRVLMQPKLLEGIRKLLSREIKPSLDDYHAFFSSLINNRWLYYLAVNRTVEPQVDSIAYYRLHPELWQQMADTHKKELLHTLGMIVENFAAHLENVKGLNLSESIVAEQWLSHKFRRLFTHLPVVFRDLKADLELHVEDDRFLFELLNILKGDDYIWNGSKLRASKKFTELDSWKHLHRQALQQLANYLVFHSFLPEQMEILSIWGDVLREYDKLIYRYKNLTYDDIAWFTFAALYTSESKLFDTNDEPIVNEFYEFMCHRTRFMLIDEFQDTSILQFNILSPMIEELLAGAGSYPYGGIIVVGDEKQSIFGWRGGQRDLLLNLDTIFQKGIPAERDALTHSWRSSPTLMKFINGIFNHPFLSEHLEQKDADWHYIDTTGKKTELENDTKIEFKIEGYASRSKDNKIEGVMRKFVQEMVIPALPLEGDKGRTVAILARKNDELDKIRAILAENDISCEFQSSKSLLDHAIIKAIIFLLRFSVYRDWYDLLAFLRSDLVLLDGTALKKVIDVISDIEQGKALPEPAFSEVPEAKAAMELAAKIDAANIYQSILTILETCQIQDKLPLQRDFANLQRFMDLALEYESNFQSELPELQGFLRWCTDNSKRDIMQQQDVESTTALQLLTIHSSKGLEFDNVFVWWNLSGMKGREDNCLNSWMQYADEKYHDLRDIALTLHYGKVLQASSFKDLMLEEKKRLDLEALNTLYVALSRARNRLSLWVTYDKKQSWCEYIETLAAEEKRTSSHFAVSSALDYMQRNAQKLGDYHWQIVASKCVEPLSVRNEQADESGKCSGEINLRDILPDWRKPELNLNIRKDGIPLENMKLSYLEQRDNLKGDIAHFFMAQLKYASIEEIVKAESLTMRQFGNLMKAEALRQIIDRIKKQLPELAGLFEPEYDIIYNEYPIRYKGSEYRIDRLMLNTKARKYRIVDYKTGGVYDADQLQRYDTILRAKFLPKDYLLEQELKPTPIKL